MGLARLSSASMSAVRVQSPIYRHQGARPCPQRPTSSRARSTARRSFELIRDRLADILEIEPGDHQRGRLLRRRPRRRLARAHRAGRGPRGGARRAHGRLPHRGRGPRGPEDRPRRRRLRRRQAGLTPCDADRPRRARRRGSATPSPTPTLLALALTHRSWCAENAGHESNERLEFLGDAVLGLVVTDHLFAAYPRHARGRAGQGRGPSVVSAAALAEVAAELDLGDGLLLGKGEDASGGRRQAVDPRRRPRGGASAPSTSTAAATAAQRPGARPARRPHRRRRRGPRRPRLQDPAAGARGPRLRAAARLRAARRGPRSREAVLRHGRASAARSHGQRRGPLARSRPSRRPPAPAMAQLATTAERRGPPRRPDPRTPVARASSDDA